MLATDEDRETYLDAYAPGDANQHVAGAAVGPQSTEEVQAIIRIANEHKVPLWPISRGKNLGYGGCAPRMSGTVVLDLTRMNRILDVDEKFGDRVIEPGVGFFDLFNYLQATKFRCGCRFPRMRGAAWSAMRSSAATATRRMGNNTNNICGMEVVLADGELVRTGTGAMSNSPNWHLFKYGFGPSWDQVFVQSNFGVVTKMGMWLMPEPESTSA